MVALEMSLLRSSFMPRLPKCLHSAGFLVPKEHEVVMLSVSPKSHGLSGKHFVYPRLVLVPRPRGNAPATC